MLLQIWYSKEIPEYVRLCMESAKRAYNSHKYVLLRDKEYSELRYTISADIQRLKYASEVDDLIYVDADCYVFRSYKPNLRTKPSFGGGSENDIFYFRNNGCKDLFKRLYKKAVKDLVVDKVNPYSYGYRAFRRIDSDKISRDSFFHLHAQRRSREGCNEILKRRLKAFYQDNQ